MSENSSAFKPITLMKELLESRGLLILYCEKKIQILNSRRHLKKNLKMGSEYDITFHNMPFQRNIIISLNSVLFLRFQ